MGYRPLTVIVTTIAGRQEAIDAVNLPMEGRKTVSDKTKLISKLVKAGDDHGKVARGIYVWLEVGMQAGFMIEFDTYRVGIDTLSTTSSMHNELRYLKGEELARYKQEVLCDKYYRRSLVVSYQTLRRMYIQRRSHKHPDWQRLCDFIESLPDFTTFIYPEGGEEGDNG